MLIIKYRLVQIVLLTLLLSLNTNITYGQWNFSLSISQEYNDNPFLSPNPQPTSISLLNIGVEREINSLGLGYYGSQSFYSDLSDRNYYWHQLGLWNIWENIKWGAYYEGRFNSTEYQSFNYSEYTTYLNTIFETEDFYWFLNASLVYTDYNELNDLNNLAALGGVSLNKSFETKTTLMTGLNLNFNYYANSGSTSSAGSKGNGRNIEESVSSTNTQLVLWARGAQSVTPSTGLAAQLSYRTLLNTVSNELWENSGVIGDESYYFDDPYSHEGYTANLRITQNLPGDISLVGSFYYNEKSYPSMAIFLDPETISYSDTRFDKQKIFELGLNKSISLNILGESELLLGFNYRLINNESNSYWYNYNSGYGAMKLQFQF